MNLAIDTTVIKLPFPYAEFHYRHLITESLWVRLTGRVLKDNPDFTIEKAESVIDGALGFLSLCAKFPEVNFVPSHLVDIGWHAFILYTCEYQEFCKRIAGHFIHHEPNDGEQKIDDGINSGTTVRFMDENNFSYNPSIWKILSKDCDVDCTDSCKNCSGNSCTKSN